MFQASFIVSQHLLNLAFLVHKLLSLDSAHSCEVIAGACTTDERLKALQVRPPAYLTSAYIVLPCTLEPAPTIQAAQEATWRRPTGQNALRARQSCP